MGREAATPVLAGRLQGGKESSSKVGHRSTVQAQMIDRKFPRSLEDCVEGV